MGPQLASLSQRPPEWGQRHASGCSDRPNTRVPAERASFSVLALFKNEGDILWEWSGHYLDQGVTQIILINNCSDDWRGALGELGQDRRII